MKKQFDPTQYLTVEQIMDSLKQHPSMMAAPLPVARPGDIVSIEGTSLQRLEYGGQPVVTLDMVAQAHSKAADNIWKNFDRHRDRFIPGEDFVVLSYEEWSALVPPRRGYQRGKNQAPKGGHRGKMILLKLSGYLMLTKTFADELSWRVQRSLVNRYFSSERQISALEHKLFCRQADLIEAQAMKIRLLTRKANKISDKEKREMIDLWRQDLKTSEIADRMCRSVGSVKEHLAAARKAGLISEVRKVRGIPAG